MLKKSFGGTGRKRDAMRANTKRGIVGDRRRSVTRPEQKSLYPRTRQSVRNSPTGSWFSGNDELFLQDMSPQGRFSFCINTLFGISEGTVIDSVILS